MIYPSLTIAYITSRKDPRIEWFFDALEVEAAGVDENYRKQLQVLVVDGDLYEGGDDRRKYVKKACAGRFDVQHVPPKPTVWQGPHRLTSRDYFCAANARNTVFALAKHDHVVFIDDLSVPMPGWLSGHIHAATHKYALCGITNKHCELVVEGGRLVSFKPYQPGRDTRVGQMQLDFETCTGAWLYGGTFSVPLEAALMVNGQDEIHDVVGGEDYDFGVRLIRAGWSMWINKNCGTVEAEDLHYASFAVRLDKPVAVDGPYSSNMLYNRLQRERTRTWTIGNEFNLRDLRAHVLVGNPFPIPTKPDRHWVDGQPLSEL